MRVLQITLFILATISIMFPSCKSMNKSQKGAVIGTAAGGATGAVVGKVAGNTALGAIIGAAVGGVTGSLIGRKMDKQAEELKNKLPEVSVTRVGEAIIVEFANDILFGFDSYKISAQSDLNLAKLVEILKSYPDTDITIAGHTDSQGSSKYNQALSLRRADAVAKSLIAKNISALRIITLGYGEQNAKYTNATESGRASNRRVELLITANEKMVEDAKKGSIE